MSYKVKRVLTVTAMTLAILTTVLGVLHLSGVALKSPSEWTWNQDERNEKNLLTTDCYVSNLTSDFEKGLKIDWKDDGSFVLSGKYEDADLAGNARFTYDFANVTLNAGTYTISSGNTHCDEQEFGLVVTYGNSTEYIGSKAKTITLTDTTTVTVGVFVKNNLRLWSLTSKITPVVAAGTETIEFYQ